MIKKSLIAIAVLASTSAFAQYSPESVELAKAVPIADVHFHFDRHSYPSLDFYKDNMHRNNVKWAGAVGTYEPEMSRDIGERYIAAYGQKEFTIAFFQQGESALTSKDLSLWQGMFAEAESLFKQGKIKGFGEIHSDNHASGPAFFQRHIHVDSPVIDKMFEIANRYKGFVQLHSQYDDDFIADLTRLTTAYPDTTVVLSHCLSTRNPDEVEKAFRISPKIVCEVSSNGVHHIETYTKGRLSRGRIWSKTGPTQPWIDFINKYPDRIMVGSDPSIGLLKDYDILIEEIRTKFLPYFEPSVVEKLAYKNALTIFRINEK